MPERLKVLISAYACEPNKGSEPEVGWQLALHMARFHDVTVLTRANNQTTIEAGLANHTGERPGFIYYDLPGWVLALKRRGLPIAVYYFFWQIGVRFFLRERLSEFDVIHHATFNSFRNPGFWWSCPTAVVVGPLGGGQICPWRFLPWFRKQIVHELMRSLSVVNSYIFPHIYLSLYFSRRILVANQDTANCVPWLFHPKIQAMLETAVTPEQILESRPPRNWEGFRLLWISRLDKLKGGELAIRAFGEAVKRFPGMTLTMVGRGREERPLRRLIKRLGLESSVTLRGSVPKAQVIEFMLGHDAFVFTSLRDTSGNVVLEAMAAGLPVITFLHHGVAEITTEKTAIRVPITKRTETVVHLGQAMLMLAQSPDLCHRLGRAGQARVKGHYLWGRHAEEMDVIYRQVVAEEKLKEVRREKTLRIILVPKGIILVCAILALIGALEFYSMTRLNTQARAIIQDTLPGLTYAGEANATLAQAFNRTLLLLVAESAQEQETLRNEIESISGKTTSYLNAYKAQIFSAEDQALFDTLLARRGEYLGIRQRMLDLAESNKRREALAMCRAEVLPSYLRYKEAGDKLFEFNIQQGRTRGETIMTVCRVTQFVVAGIAVLIFIVGFLFGMSR